MTGRLSYRNYGGNGSNGLRVVGLIASVGGEVTISGELASPATDLGTGPIPGQLENFFVARFDAAGNAVYVKPTFPQGFVPILGGYYNGSGVTFGDVTLPDGTTGFIARVAP